MRRPNPGGSALKAKKAENGDIAPTPSGAQPQSNEPLAHPSAVAAVFNNSMLARAVLEAGASPEPPFAWWLFRGPASGLLAVRVLDPEELRRGPFPASVGNA